MRLTVVVGVSLALTASFCCRCCRFLVVVVGVPFLASAYHRRCCISHVDSGFPPRGCLPRLRRLVVVGVVSVLSSSLARSCSRWRQRPSLGCFRGLRSHAVVVAVGASCRRLFVVVCAAFSLAASLCRCFFGFLLSLSVFCCCRRRLFVVYVLL